MPRCDQCHHRSCRCPKLPIATIEAVCPEKKIRVALPLCMTWDITFDFLSTKTINPLTFDATGLFNIQKGCLQSVSTAFFAPNRPPTSDDLDQSTICLPIAGITGSITGEVYFFGDRVDYVASLKPYLLEDGKTVTLLTNFVTTTVDANMPVQLIFVARLFYCACPAEKKCC